MKLVVLNYAKLVIMTKITKKEKIVVRYCRSSVNLCCDNWFQI